jgi:hypothetical protein
MSDTSDSYADRLVLGVMDYFPFMPVFIGNPFACKVCGQVRSVGGVLSGVMNKEGGVG